MTTLVKPSKKLACADRLSQLDLQQAAKLLGPIGKKPIQKRSAREIRLREAVYLGGDLLRVSFPSLADGAETIATLTLSSDVPQRLRWNSDRCDTACEHVGALLTFVLENKTGRRQAAPAPERQTAGELSEEAIVERALADRRERAQTERMRSTASTRAGPIAHAPTSARKRSAPVNT
jgi:hypothetical protein